MPDLFDAPAQPAPDSHAGRRQAFSPVDHGQTYERLSSAFPGSQLHAVKLTLPVGYRSERVAHDGDEFVYVLAGQVQYTVGDRPYPLGPGDSLHFNAHQAHWLENLGRQTRAAGLGGHPGPVRRAGPAGHGSSSFRRKETVPMKIRMITTHAQAQGAWSVAGSSAVWMYGASVHPFNP